MLNLISILPLITLLGLIVIGRRSVLFSASVSIVVITFLSIYYWGVDVLRILSASAKGILIAGEIGLVIFSALLIYNLLHRSTLLLHIKNLLEYISLDKRVHVILIGWALIYFIEGISGFGTPAIIAIPLLLALGFKPLTAVVMAIVGDSIPVIFGAIGLPITYGMNTSLQTIGENIDILHVAKIISLFNIVGAILVPILLLYIYGKSERKPIEHIIEFIPFAIFTGLIMSLISIATVYTTGPEMASVMGGLVGIIVVITMAKHGILIPRTESIEILRPIKNLRHKISNTIKAISPYLLLALLLILSRLPELPIRDFLRSYSWNIQSLLNFKIDYSFLPLFSAGTIMLLVAVISIFIANMKYRDSMDTIKFTLQRIWRPFSSLVLILIFVQIYLYSGENTLGIHAMPIYLAEALSQISGNMWPLIAPMIGSIGAFVAGSVTVSNLIFSGIQYGSAVNSGFDVHLILALQGLGAAFGNIIAPHNIVAALAVAGTSTISEYKIIRKNIPILLAYLLIIGIIGMLIINT